MASITHGNATCEGQLSPMGDGVGCVVQLNVSPPGGPSDWGMCGVLSMSADFGPATVARIIVDSSGHYAAKLVGASPTLVPSLHWTCVLFSDFSGTPKPAYATYSAPAPLVGVTSETTVSTSFIGTAKDACIWAGVAGNVEHKFNDGAFGFASAQAQLAWTLLGAQNATTFASCFSYSAPSWTEWTYLYHSDEYWPSASGDPIGEDESSAWCYMTMIDAALSSPGFSPGLISAGLKISSGSYSDFADPENGVSLGFDCLPLLQ
jgi:hypothetical protein